MALSLATIGTAGTNNGSTFYTQVQGALQAQVTAVLAEAASTAEHNVRYLAAKKCEVAGASYVPGLCVIIAQQLPGTYSNLSAVADADVNTAFSGIWTQFAYSICTLT